MNNGISNKWSFTAVVHGPRNGRKAVKGELYFGHYPTLEEVMQRAEISAMNMVSSKRFKPSSVSSLHVTDHGDTRIS